MVGKRSWCCLLALFVGSLMVVVFKGAVLRKEENEGPVQSSDGAAEGV
jgi:hypothetical protein